MGDGWVSRDGVVAENALFVEDSGSMRDELVLTGALFGAEMSVALVVRGGVVVGDAGDVWGRLDVKGA
jgi:hypothetical protein